MVKPSITFNLVSNAIKVFRIKTKEVLIIPKWSKHRSGCKNNKEGKVSILFGETERWNTTVGIN